MPQPLTGGSLGLPQEWPGWDSNPGVTCPTTMLAGCVTWLCVSVSTRVCACVCIRVCIIVGAHTCVCMARCVCVYVCLAHPREEPEGLLGRRPSPGWAGGLLGGLELGERLSLPEGVSLHLRATGATEAGGLGQEEVSQGRPLLMNFKISPRHSSSGKSHPPRLRFLPAFLMPAVFLRSPTVVKDRRQQA